MLSFLKRCPALNLFFLFFLLSASALAQDTPSPFEWKVTSEKINAGTYQLSFSTPGNHEWELYGPNEVISDVRSTELEFDSSVTAPKEFTDSGEAVTITSALFDNAKFKVFSGPATFSTTITINGKVPAKLLGKFSYTYGKGDEFYPLTPWSFNVPLEGGVESSVRIRINSLDLNNPVSGCGDDEAGGKA